MAENNQNPPGGEAPKSPEPAKVQPKKETVRINLPPKPTAAPTIKIPAPAPPAAVASPAATASAPTAPAAAPAAAHPAPAAARPAAAAAPRSSAPARHTPASAAPALNPVDKALAIGAAIIGVLVVLRIVTLGA